MERNQRKQPIDVDGQRYENLTEAAKAHSLDSKKVHERVRCGWTIKEALEIATRTLPSLDYKKRKEAFAKQQGLKVQSVETRLAVRRNRFRDWLSLPRHSPTKHANTVTVTDKHGNTHSSMKEAAKAMGVHRYSIPKFASQMQRVQKYPFESEMPISAETLVLLCSHPNVLEKDDLSKDGGHTILLDNLVRIRLIYVSLDSNGVLVYLRCVETGYTF